MMLIIGTVGGIVGTYLTLWAYGAHLRRQNPRYHDKKQQRRRRGPDETLRTGERVNAVLRDSQGRLHHVN